VDIKWRQKTDYLQVSSKQLPSVNAGLNLHQRPERKYIS
jgi:hypothetical protein